MWGAATSMRSGRRWPTAGAGLHRDGGDAMIRWRAWLTTVSLTVLAVAPRAGAEPWVYVTNERGNSLSIIDGATDKVVGRVSVGERPRGVALSPDGRSAYVALGEEDVIAVVDTATRAVTARIAAGSDPEAFAVSPDGARLYVSNEDAGTASVIDVKSGKVVATVPVGTEPEGVAASP